MTKSIYTIDEYLKTRASNKNKIIALSIAMLTVKDKDDKEYERLRSLQEAYIEIEQKNNKIIKIKK